MDRAARDAATEAADLNADAREQLEEPIENAKAAIAQRLDAMRKGFASMSRAFDEAAARVSALDAQARGLDDVAAQAIRLYRQENADARADAAPDYFSAPPAPSRDATDDPLANAAALTDEARARLGAAQAASAEALDALLSALEDSAAQLGRGA
jgi:hypothetical protein